jgi:hypothetical protein
MRHQPLQLGPVENLVAIQSAESIRSVACQKKVLPAKTHGYKVGVGAFLCMSCPLRQHRVWCMRRTCHNSAPTNYRQGGHKNAYVGDHTELNLFDERFGSSGRRKQSLTKNK